MRHLDGMSTKAGGQVACDAGEIVQSINGQARLASLLYWFEKVTVRCSHALSAYFTKKTCIFVGPNR